MNKGEQIYQIKQALKKLFTMTENEVQKDTEMGEKKMFKDFEVNDGTKLTTPADTLDVGVDIFGVDTEGKQFALNNGDYTLTDGRIVSVEDGKVKSISEPAKSEESPIDESEMKKMEELPTSEDEEEGEEVESEGESEMSTEERVSKIEEVLGKVLMAINEIQKAHEEMMGKVNKFSEEPGAESIRMEKGIGVSTDPKEFNKRKNFSEIEELRELIKLSRKENNNIKI